MNILEKLNEKDISIDVRYYGLEDLSTGIKVKELLEGKDIILEHYSNKQIHNINNYIDYVFLDFIMNFEEVLPYIKEDKKQEFLDFFAECKLIYKEYNIKDVINYIKNSYKDIYSFEDNEDKSLYLAHDLKKHTSDFVALHFNSFDIDIFDYIIDEATYDVIDCFDKWQKYFIKNPNELSKLFNKNNIEKVLYMRFEEVANILENLNNNDKFSETIINAVEIIYFIIKEKFFNPIGEYAILESYYMLNDCLLFLKKLKSPHVYELEKELEKQEVIFNENLLKNGHVQTIEYDLKPFVDFFENKKNPWEIRIVYLTHFRNKEGKIVSFLEHGAKCNSKALTDDFARKNPGTDDYFTSWRLRNLNLEIFEIKARFMSLMNTSSNISEYLSDIYGELKYICTNIETSMELECFDENIEMLSQFLTDLFINLRNNNNNHTKVTIKNNIFGCSILICGLIEKVLRIIYKYSMRNISYISDSNITLGSLLNETDKKSNIILDILGKEQIKCLRYYLHKIDPYNAVGKNIRNDLAHLNGRTIKRLDYDLVYELLSYLTSVLNSCVLYYQKKNKLTKQ